MKVLLASDGSENALEAAKFLLRLAPATPLEVTVVSVSFEPGHPRNSAVQPWYPEWVTREKERFSTHQDVIKKLFAPTGRPVHGVHRFGDPVPSLLEETQQLEPDLVVLGAKGHSAIHRLLLGSTSDSVATHVGCSVVVVRGKHDAASTSPSAAATPKPLKLLLAYDGSSGSREAVAEQLEIGWPESTEVQLVSVAAHAYAFFDDTYAAMAAAYESEEVERVRLEAERMCGTIANRFANTTLQVPRANHVGDAIVAAAEASGSELVVVGDAGHSMIGELFLGSSTKYVLRHAPCSVWISRHHRRQDEPTTNRS